MLLIFYIFTSDPVMNSCHNIICGTLIKSDQLFVKVHLFPLGAGVMLIISTFLSYQEKEYS